MGRSAMRFVYQRRAAEGVRYVKGMCHCCRQDKPISTTCRKWADGSRGTCDDCRKRGGPPDALLNGKEIARIDEFVRERFGKFQFNRAPTRQKKAVIMSEYQELRAEPVATEPFLLHDLRFGHQDYWSI